MNNTGASGGGGLFGNAGGNNQGGGLLGGGGGGLLGGGGGGGGLLGGGGGGLLGGGGGGMLGGGAGNMGIGTLNTKFNTTKNKDGHQIHSINAIKELHGRSLDELRFEDYRLMKNAQSLPDNYKQALQNKIQGGQQQGGGLLGGNAGGGLLGNFLKIFEFCSRFC